MIPWKIQEPPGHKIPRGFVIPRYLSAPLKHPGGQDTHPAKIPRGMRYTGDIGLGTGKQGQERQGQQGSTAQQNTPGFINTPSPSGAEMKQKRADHEGPQRSAFEKNKKKILLSQSICGICGKPVDKRIRYPDPMSACIDHIIPIDRGGNPSAIENLQLAHLCCNRQKSDKIIASVKDEQQKRASNRDLPLSMDWTKYRAAE